MAYLRDTLNEMLEPVLETLGYELVLLEFSPSSHHSLLRLYIDSPGGINVDDCEKVSREVAAVLDVEDPIPSGYRLEVSSPGLDRPLIKPAHFERFMQSIARVQLNAPRNGRRKFIGTIAGATDSAVTLQTAEGTVEIPYSEMERARLVPDYDREFSR